MAYYGLLDRTPRGRDEQGSEPMWIRRHDEYEGGWSRGHVTGRNDDQRLLRHRRSRHGRNRRVGGAGVRGSRSRRQRRCARSSDWSRRCSPRRRLAWWSTVERMAGMDAGPGTALGSLGWFTGVWATMMAAMMLPSLAPSAAVFAGAGPARAQPGPPVRRRLPARLECRGRRCLRACSSSARACSLGSLAWHSGGRWLAASVLVLAALYQLTPLKRAFLSRCRSPLRSLDTSWQNTGRERL